VAVSGDGALLSHGSAAELWNVVEPRPAGDPIDVTVIGRNRGHSSRIRRHRVDALEPVDIRIHQRVPVTSVARTILDLAAERDIEELEQIVAVAERRRLTTPARLRAVLARYPSRRGAQLLEAILAAADDPAMTRSRAERCLFRLLRQANLQPPIVNVPMFGYEVEFFWPTANLVVEVDGYDFHSDRAKFESDRRRDAMLVANGIRGLRFTGRQIEREPLTVLARIAQALGQAHA
jgi:very-short-patch-repair endonuclease